MDINQVRELHTEADRQWDKRRRKLTSDDIKEIIRKSGHKVENEDTPFGDVPSAQPPARPFHVATKMMLQDASTQMNEHQHEVTPVVMPQHQPKAVIQPKQTAPQEAGYFRAVIGDRHYGQKKGKPVSHIDKLNRLLW